MNTLRARKKTLPVASTTGLSRSVARLIAQQSSLFRETVAERDEILRHKWLLSERAGRDVGFSAAAYDWIMNHRAAWRLAWRKRNSAAPVSA